MPEITLRFKNAEDAEMYLQGPLMHMVIWEFESYLRNKLKYEEISSKEREVFEQVKEKWFEIKGSHQPDFPQ